MGHETDIRICVQIHPRHLRVEGRPILRLSVSFLKTFNTNNFVFNPTYIFLEIIVCVVWFLQRLEQMSEFDLYAISISNIRLVELEDKTCIQGVH